MRNSFAEAIEPAAFTRFTTPAGQGSRDFADLGLEGELAAFEADWSVNVAGWTQAAIVADPWSNVNDAPRVGYYNPLESGFGSDGAAVISWTPFPQRLVAFLTQPGSAQNPQLGGTPLTMDQVMALADAGEMKIGGRTLKLYDPDGSGEVRRSRARAARRSIGRPTTSTSRRPVRAAGWTNTANGRSPTMPRGR